MTTLHLPVSLCPELCWAQVETVEFGCWGLCSQMMCPGHSYLAIAGKKFHETFSHLTFIFLSFFLFSHLAFCGTVPCSCVHWGAFQKQTGCHKQDWCYQSRHFFIQTIKDYPKDCTWEQSLWFCSNLLSQSLFQRASPNSIFVMIPMKFFFSLDWFYFLQKYKNMELFHCPEFTC